MVDSKTLKIPGLKKNLEKKEFVSLENKKGLIFVLVVLGLFPDGLFPDALFCARDAAWCGCFPPNPAIDFMGNLENGINTIWLKATHWLPPYQQNI